MPETLKILFKRIQEGMEGLADAVLGERAERLLDNEIRTVDDALHQARGEHAAVKARRIASEQHLAASNAELATAEARVDAALRQRRAQQARAAAEQVVRLQERREDWIRQSRLLVTQEQQLAHATDQLEGRLRRLRHQIDILRASISLQRAQATVARRQPGEALHPEPAFASAQRMKRRGATGAGAVENDRAATSAADPAQAVLARAEKRIKSSPRKR